MIMRSIHTAKSGRCSFWCLQRQGLPSTYSKYISTTVLIETLVDSLGQFYEQTCKDRQKIQIVFSRYFHIFSVYFQYIYLFHFLQSVLR